MNSNSFGKECQCDHLESDHVAVKRIVSIPGPHDLGTFLPHPPDLDSKRSNCKLCNCSNFKPKKKGWGF